MRSLTNVCQDTHPTILTIDETRRSPVVSEADGVAADKYVNMRRVHLLQRRPYCVTNIYLDALVFAKHRTRFRKETVIPILLAMPTVKIATARQTFTISTADLELARHLGVSVNAPVAEVRRVFTGRARRIIYRGEVTYRGDFIHMEFDLKS